jgi:hypothetical protein
MSEPTPAAAAGEYQPTVEIMTPVGVVQATMSEGPGGDHTATDASPTIHGGDESEECDDPGPGQPVGEPESGNSSRGRRSGRGRRGAKTAGRRGRFEVVSSSSRGPHSKPTITPTTVPTSEPTAEPTTPPTDRVPMLKRSVRLLEKLKKRAETGGEMSGIAQDISELCESCYFTDWSTHEPGNLYWSLSDFAFVSFESDAPEGVEVEELIKEDIEEGYRAVTENVPKNWEAALKDPKWGVPAQTEINTILAAKAMVQVKRELALDAIRNHNADLMYLFPVYEEKVKEGQLVYKVRLVADGRTHKSAGETYSATPSREELLILMHVIAALGWSYAHIDEKRAFLKAAYQGETEAFVKFRGGDEYYQVLGALYGLKTAPKDYQAAVAKRLETLGFTRLKLCNCIYIKEVATEAGTHVVIVYDYVDDFIFTGSDRATTESVITAFRTLCETTEPIWEASSILGMEFIHDRDRRTVSITMTEKIEHLCEKAGLDTTHGKEKHVPIPQSGYVIKDYEFESMKPEQAELLDNKGIHEYMAIVGGLIWVSGLRFDIVFSTMYLAWNTKEPRVHHMNMARHVLAYLYTTKHLPLVLGGEEDIEVTTFTDASLGTAPKGRSVIANITKLNSRSGAVSAQSKATDVVFTSSFEAELDGVTRGLKASSRTINILTELRHALKTVPRLWSDNMAMVKFIQGEGIAKGVRHMELRMWFVRERYQQGNVIIDWMSGKEIPADKLTKLGTREEHELFTREIMGHCLLE